MQPDRSKVSHPWTKNRSALHAMQLECDRYGKPPRAEGPFRELEKLRRKFAEFGTTGGQQCDIDTV